MLENTLNNCAQGYSIGRMSKVKLHNGMGPCEGEYSMIMCRGTLLMAYPRLSCDEEM